MKAIIYDNFARMADMLEKFTGNGENIDAIERAATVMVEALRGGHKIIACGNGGSLCDATHFAEELTARFRHNRKALPAIAINDSAFLTCVGNDFGFEEVFSRFVEACGEPEDVLLGITTSGNSANVVAAARIARGRGLKVVAMTGARPGQIAPLSDVHISTPPSEYSDRVQEIHIKVIHTLVQLIEHELGLV